MSREHRPDRAESRGEDVDVELGSADRALLRAIDAELRPAPMTAARAARFDRELIARIEAQPARWVQWAPPLVASAAAAAALLVALLPEAEPEPLQVENELVALVYPALDSGAVSAELSEHLPAEYQVLSAVLEDGDADR
jgi:hypothetical protein